MTGDRLRQHFEALFNHVEWADRLVLASLRDAGTPPPKALEVYDATDAPITYRNRAGDQFTSTLDAILTHVALHGSYHRGQIAALLRGADQTPNPTDYIAFRRGAPAATRRDAEAAR